MMAPTINCQDGSITINAGSLSGLVAYTNTGQPARGVLIERRSRDWKRVVEHRTTDTQGRFAFGPVSDGKYYLRAYRRCIINERVVVEVRAGNGEPISLVAEAGSGDCVSRKD